MRISRHTSRTIVGIMLALVAAATAIGLVLPAIAGQPSTAHLICGPLPEVVRPPVVRFVVRLVDAEGTPLAERAIRWERAGDASVLLLRRETVTDADGFAATDHILPFDVGLDDTAAVVARYAGEEAHGPASCLFEFRRVSEPLPSPRPR